MATTKPSLFASRGPVYFGGLLISLAAMVGIFQAKRAMMPKFHEVSETRPEVTIAPGGGVRFVYSEDPGYFLIPGFPTGVILSRRKDDGSLEAINRVGYGALVEKEPLVGPITEEGSYNVDADFYICAQPGVADCTKLLLSQDFRVDRNATAGDDRIEIDLSKLAQYGLKQGPQSETAEPAAKTE